MCCELANKAPTHVQKRSFVDEYCIVSSFLDTVIAGEDESLRMDGFLQRVRSRSEFGLADDEWNEDEDGVIAMDEHEPGRVHHRKDGPHGGKKEEEEDIDDEDDDDGDAREMSDQTETKIAHRQEHQDTSMLEDGSVIMEMHHGFALLLRMCSSV
jgi:hypothetical protein